MDRHSRRTAPFFFRYLLAGCLILAGGVLPQLAQAADPDGSLDTSFNTGSGLGGSQPVYAVATGEDGRLVVAGFFSSYNGTVKNILRVSMSTAHWIPPSIPEVVWICQLKVSLFSRMENCSLGVNLQPLEVCPVKELHV
jgi:hypothetical protein